MERLLKNTFIVALGIILYSCQQKISPSLPILPDIDECKYVFNNTYKVTDMNLYVGDKGEKLYFEEAKAKQFWSNLTVPYGDTIIINWKNDSIFLNDSFHINKYKMLQKNDSIFILRNNDLYTFFGKTDTSNDKFITHLGFYIVHKPKDQFGYAFARGTDFQLQSYDRRFYKNSWFESPSEMIVIGDTVAWCNVFYTFDKNAN